MKCKSFDKLNKSRLIKKLIKYDKLCIEKRDNYKFYYNKQCNGLLNQVMFDFKFFIKKRNEIILELLIKSSNIRRYKFDKIKWKCQSRMIYYKLKLRNYKYKPIKKN